MKLNLAIHIGSVIGLNFLIGCSAFQPSQVARSLSSVASLKNQGAVPSHPSSFGPPAQELSTAMTDLGAHFWDNSGHILNVGDTPTGNGYASSGLASMWERSQYMFVMNDYVLLTGDQGYKGRIGAEWNYIKAYWPQHGYTNAVYTDCTKTFVNAEDDAGWLALYYLAAYKNTGDQTALDYAGQMVKCSYSYFGTGGGPLKYFAKDAAGGSAYEVPLMTAAYEIYQINHDASYRALAMQTYNWMQNSQPRADGLYWDEIVNGTPIWFMNNQSAVGMINQIGAAGMTSSSLHGNMAMALMNARLFAETGDANYKQLALKTAQGLANKYTDANGVLVNDRDGWVDAAFAPRFAREVVPLVGAKSKIATVLFNTAASIMTNARSGDGYYGADWAGGNAWSSGATNYADGGMCGPQQLMTNANSTAIILAAAIAAQVNPTTGSLDDVDASNTLSGWACAQGLPASVQVDVYVGDEFPNGTYVGRYDANQASEDGVAQACQSSGSNYRFTIALGDSVNNYAGQNIYVYAISPTQGTNALLPGSGNFQLSATDTASSSVAATPAPAPVTHTPTPAKGLVAVVTPPSNDPPANNEQPQDQVQAEAQAQADARAQAQAAAQAQAQAEQQLRAQAAQDAAAQAAAVAAAAEQSADAGRAAASQAFAARQTQTVYRYANGKGAHLFSLSADGTNVPPNYSLEGAVFQIYVAAYASTAPLFRCQISGHQFLSVDAGCEGQTVKGIIGYISTVQIRSLAPLYRMNNGGDYLEDTGTDEGAGAGYAVEGVLGFVPGN